MSLPTTSKCTTGCPIWFPPVRLFVGRRLDAGWCALSPVVPGHAGREPRFDHRCSRPATGRAVGLGLGGAAMRAPSARAAWLAWIAPPAPEAVVLGAVGALDLRLLLDGPPDQPHPVEDRDLEDHGQEDDRHNLSHVRESTRDQ